MTPLLFQGQEWAAGTPFPFFSDHPASWVSGHRGPQEGIRVLQRLPHQEVPDPQDRRTFESAKLNWSEREHGEHGRTLALYRALLRLRREDPVLQPALAPEPRGAGSVGDVLWVRQDTPDGERGAAVELGQEPVGHAALALPDPLPAAS